MEMEGLQASVQMSVKLIDVLEKLFGFSWHTGMGLVGFVGKGFGKSVRLLYDLHKSNKMLSGGERKFQEIVKNKGSLDMAITTVHIETWDSEAGKELQEYLKNRGIQYVLLDDMTKGNNKVQFMYHASDAQRVNHLLTEYKKLSFDHAKSVSQVYDELPAGQKGKINETFDLALSRVCDYEESLYWQMQHGEQAEKKTAARDMARKQLRSNDSLANVYEAPLTSVMIPGEYVKVDKFRNLGFIRSGKKGYTLPLSCLEQVVAGDGILDVKYKCKIDPEGIYMEFNDGRPVPVLGKDLEKELRKLNNGMDPYRHSYKRDRDRNKERGRGDSMGKNLPHKPKPTNGIVTKTRR